MQSTETVTETLSDGLKREFRVVVPANDLAAKVDAKLDDLKGQVQIRGFRPGKVPVSHLKRLYGRSAMAEAIENTVRETNERIFSDRGLKLANAPKITMGNEEKDVENVIAGKQDLDYTVAIEIIPKIELADFKTIKVTKLSTEVTDAEVEDAVKKIAEQNRPYVARGEGEAAEKDDRVTISFVGRIDGVPFEGGKGEDIPVQIGSNSFIPGFEEQLIGVKAGETRTLNAKFPDAYQAPQLAGKDAAFEVTVKSIEKPGEMKTDDDFAKTLGMESLSKLRDAVKENITRGHSNVSRQKLKRQLLDALDKSHKFDPPPSLVDEEYERIWKSVNDELKATNKTFADENTTEDKAREEYRGIADRRVRLGLLLAEIGEKNNIQITDEELNRALVERIRQFPGQEQKAWDYYRNTPEAMASLRAPIFEDKVVDFLLELAQVSDKKVSRDELYKDDDAKDEIKAAG